MNTTLEYLFELEPPWVYVGTGETEDDDSETPMSARILTKDSPIHTAAVRGDVVALGQLVAGGMDIDARADAAAGFGCFLEGLTPLMVAAGSGSGANVETLRWLLEHGAVLRAVSDGGVTAAFYAAGMGGWTFRSPDRGGTPGDVERLRFLLDAGLDAREVAQNGRSLLTEACIAGDALRVALLLERGARVEPTRAASAELGTHGEVANELDSYQIPLFVAAEAGAAECVAVLIRAGANVNRRDAGRRTALMYSRSSSVTALLLAAGADVHAMCEYGNDVLDELLTGMSGTVCVAAEELAAIGELLLAADAPLHRAGAYGFSRLDSAASARLVPAVRFLLERGSKDSLFDALERVCWHGEYSDSDFPAATEAIIDLLVAAGANVRDPAIGRAALQSAIQGDWENPTAVRALLRHGADANCRDDCGRTPLMWAVMQDAPECVRVLLDAGADPSVRDNEGRTAAEIARGWIVQHMKPQIGMPGASIRELEEILGMLEAAEGGRRSG